MPAATKALQSFSLELLDEHLPYAWSMSRRLRASGIAPSGRPAYLHTHPVESAEAGSQGGPDIEFGTEFLTPGTYRLFLDFQHDGAVRTAEFAVTVDG